MHSGEKPSKIRHNAQQFVIQLLHQLSSTPHKASQKASIYSISSPKCSLEKKLQKVCFKKSSDTMERNREVLVLQSQICWWPI